MRPSQTNIVTACTDTELAKLQRMQNRCLRVALRYDQLSNVTDLHREASLLPLKYRINKPVKDLITVASLTTLMSELEVFQLDCTTVPFSQFLFRSLRGSKNLLLTMVQLSGTLSLTISGWQVIRNTLHAC